MCALSVEILEKYDVISKEIFIYEPLTSPNWKSMGTFVTTFRNILQDGSMNLSNSLFSCFSNRKDFVAHTILREVKEELLIEQSSKSPLNNAARKSGEVPPQNQLPTEQNPSFPISSTGPPIKSASVALVGPTKILRLRSVKIFSAASS